ncbi:MAG: AMP-binding protein [Bacteroidetes bacterium]|nr:AMP-binding protein [Bacteroidota bacterium]MBU1114512.1 AMP-binding protein [Bacteroidota bacterium]MBU1799696.1 AMP-binding protein [Bacteroidota bacterium]
MKFGLSQYTLDLFFEKVLEKYPNNPALSLVGEKPFTFSEFGEKVYKLQVTLKALGIRKGDKIVILGTSSPNWAIAFMAIMTMGAVAVPVLEGFPETDIEHIIRHSDAEGIFISNSLHSTLNIELQRMKVVIKLDDFLLLDPNSKDKNIWKKIIEFPDKVIQAIGNELSGTPKYEIEEDDIAEILYTSGTTGHSKGVVLTHKNLVSNIFEGPDLLKVITEKSVVLSILPMAHAFGSTSSFLSIIYCGASIVFMDKKPSPKALLETMQLVKPTIFGSVPLVFEKIYQKRVLPTIAQNRLFKLLSKGKTTKRLLNKIIGKKIKKLFGGKLDCVIIGGASFSPEVETFLIEGEIPYCCGYGLSECAPLVTFSSMETQKMGSPGHAVTDVEIKIMDADSKSGIGEICIKGPNVMKGYYKNEEATSKSFTKDGWLISGDKGYLDKDGFLFITGRSKNVIIGPSGENIYPEVIEAKLLESSFVEEVIVYKSDNHLVARILPDYTYIENLKNTSNENRIASNVVEILENVRRETNKNLPSFSQINKVVEQTSPFLTTPTNKIKRVEYVPGYLGNNSST